MANIYIGIGSNVGDRDANLADAVRRLEKVRGVDVAAISSLYNTRPVGGPPQEDYLNGVVKVETGITPDRLLQELKDIEVKMGRRPVEEKDLPRVIDLDILLYEDMVLDMDMLRIPHPRMHERGFVLKGLAEIAPDVVHPVLGKTAEELYGEVV